LDWHLLWRTGAAAATGSVVVILETEPLKSAADVATGSITNAGGQQMHRLPIQFRLNSTPSKERTNRKALFKSSPFLDLFTTLFDIQ
jgi:hypothetical protein